MALCAVCLVTASPRRAAGQANRHATEGCVVQVEKDDLVVDLGSANGADDDDIVEIWRPLRVKHPVSGKLIAERFRIGQLRLVQVRPNLALARPEGPLSRDAQSGDVVILWGRETGTPALPVPSAVAVPTTTPPSLPAPPPRAPPTAPAASVPTPSVTDSEAPHAPEGAAAPATSKPRAAVFPRPDTELPVAHVRSVGRVVAGEPLPLALVIQGPVEGAVLHARRAGDDAYLSQPMTRIGSEYWAATVPGAVVQSPELQWFVEAVAPGGTRPVVGDSFEPQKASVEDVHPKPSRQVLGQAQIWTDYADFNAKANNDYVWQTEGVMGARLDDYGVRALRTGFGVYRGKGGTLQQLDVLNLPPNSVGLTYGYLEGEFGIAPTFSIAARAIIGLRGDGVNGGANAFFRIGSDLETNLLVGGEVLGGIGLRGITQFEWNSFRRIPIVLRSEVLNQPAGVGSDVGVRLIGQVGYRFLAHLVVAARFSYQGRTIDHAGPGSGASVGYTW
jgi:hypothetical protein